ncbi:putative lipid II flippase FtsW [Gammaproteobacteria bacterium]|nr:putative lipid II flippase FtsW [Gammaproteobacteria bacterium]
MTQSSKAYWKGPDLFIIMVFSLLLVWGVVSMTSASYFVASHKFGNGWFYFFKQLSHISIALIAATVCYLLPTRFWYKVSPLGFVTACILLTLVLIPGIGKSVNGAARWLSVFGVNLQVSELAKWLYILYMAGYIQRRQYDIQHHFLAVFIPLVLMALIGGLVLLEPDFGSLCLIVMIGMAMLFFAGMRWRYIFSLILLFSGALGAIAISAPYRLARLTTFFDPWANPFAEGYQLTQSLMAIARGGLWGVGLGQSLQKQFYLPEAHTDFIYAIMAEEVGVIGCCLILSCYILLFARMFYWMIKACRQDALFEASYMFGIMIWWSMAAIFSMAVNLGVVPTKGIALPLISYGGSNLLINFCAMAIFLKMAKQIQRDQECSY